jgi:hypothetical protein
LLVRANLAANTGKAGNAADARDQYAALLPTMYRIHGLEHPSTLFVRASFDRWAREAENAAEARDHEASLDLVVGRREDTYGKVGRNAPCPCGSGRKYKQCHGDPRRAN